MTLLDREPDAFEGGVAGSQAGLPLAISQLTIAADSPVPIYEQICRALRVAIVAGDLPVGTLLPTSRELADALDVGRNTVVAAYSRLVAEGYLVSKFRRGTRVASPPQSSPLASVSDPAPRASLDDDVGEPAVRISYQAERALELSSRAVGAAPFDANAPDPALYPRALLGRLLADTFGKAHFGDAEAQADLRRFQNAIAAHFRQARGVNCEPSQIVPVTGMSAALDLAARLILDPGHAALIEDPAPTEVRSAFRAAGARLYALPCDSAGADPAAAKAPPPRLIYVSPSLNFPAGAQMSQARRISTLNAAAAAGAIIFESDGYAELLYTGTRLGALQGTDRDGRVLYFGSLQNTLGPHIRVAFLVVPSHLTEPFSTLARRVGCVPEGFILAAVAGLIETNQYAVHVKKIRGTYAQRLKLLVDACRAFLPEVTLAEPHGGFHVTLRLPDGVRAESVVAAAAGQGLAIAPLSRFSLRPARTNDIVLGFGTIPDRLIETAMRRLATVMQDVREPEDSQAA